MKETVISLRLSQTKEMMDLLQNDAAFPLNNVHDIRKQLKKTRAENRILPSPVLIEVLEVCITARRVKSYLNDRKKHYPQLQKVSVGLIPLKELEETIQGKLNEN